MKKKLCLFAALVLSLSSVGCVEKIKARIHIKAANQAYEKEDYKTALAEYQTARTIDPEFPDLARMIGYSEIGLYVPAEKMAIIEKGKAALAKAISMKTDYFEAIVYQNLLLRQQALVETDPVKQQELIKQADELKTKAVEIVRKRKAASAAGTKS